MSETKHTPPTPGPWKVVVDGNPLSAGIVAIIQHSPEQLLTVEEGYFGGPWCAKETWEANARLIAAAPDLLEAAKRVAETCPRGPYINPRWEAAWDALTFAIVKAEGR